MGYYEPQPVWTSRTTTHLGLESGFESPGLDRPGRLLLGLTSGFCSSPRPGSR